MTASISVRPAAAVTRWWAALAPSLHLMKRIRLPEAGRLRFLEQSAMEREMWHL